MRYVIKQKFISFTDQFKIRNDSGDPVFQVKGKLISLGDQLSFQNMDGDELAKIKQELISITPSYRVYRDGTLQADVEKKLLTLLKDKFKVKMKDGSPDLEISGSILDHDYTITRDGRQVAQISKAWVSIGDSYGIDIAGGEDDILLLACVIIVDMISHDPKKKVDPVD
ncbi:MAG: LURP-one-related family protein [Anaerolineae bacterium]|nr:LURP-one-related family protein [Anaerolineae bacterium]